MERWVTTPRVELLDRALVWNQAHPRHAPRTCEGHDHGHRPHRSLATAAPPRAIPGPLDPHRIEHPGIRRRERLGGVLHEHRHAA
jgi:hypothetical protein